MGVARDPSASALHGLLVRGEEMADAVSVRLASAFSKMDRDARVAGVGLALAACVVVVQAVGAPTWTMKLGVYMLLALAIVAPTAGMTGAAALVPLRPPALFGAIGVLPTLTYAILAGCLMRLLVSRSTLRVRLLGLSVVLYFLASVYSYLRVGGVDGSRATSATSQMAQTAAGLILFICAMYLSTRMSRGVLYAAMAIVTVVVACLGLVTWLPELLESVGRSPLFRTTDYTGRAFGPFFHSNYFGMYAALALLIILAWPGGPRSRAWTAVRVVAAAAAAVAVVFSMGRGAMLAAEVGLVLLAFQRGRKAGLVATLAAVLFLIFIYPAFIDWRLSITFGSDLARAHEALDESTGWRLDVIWAGLKMFRSDPFFGVGLGQFHYVSPEYLGPTVGITYSHNWYVNVLAEQGLIGIGAFVLMLAGVGWAVARPGAAAATGALAVFAVFLAGCVTTELVSALQASGQFWIVLGLALGSASGAGEPLAVAASRHVRAEGRSVDELRAHRLRFGRSPSGTSR